VRPPSRDPVTQLDARQLNEFGRLLLANDNARIDVEQLWHALARVSPHRSSGPAERRLLLLALRSLEARGDIRLPASGGRRWDRVLDPAVPTSVDVIRGERATQPSIAWRTFPWHQNLHWVPRCRSLSGQQLDFLHHVHDGFVQGLFRELAPLKYRSLQLTGDEKLLALLAKTSLFDESRLTLEMLACLPDALPIAWESLGEGGRMVIFENAGPYAVAKRILGQLAARPYDLIAYGGGRSVIAAIDYIKTIEQPVQSIHYVGDLDAAGLEIAWCLRDCAHLRGIPFTPASALHRQMLAGAERFGYPEGWPSAGRPFNPSNGQILDVLTPALRIRAEKILRAHRRIPEEILGPDEMREAWS
jgi:uncharacterized protein DUF2399